MASLLNTLCEPAWLVIFLLSAESSASTVRDCMEIEKKYVLIFVL